MSNDGKKSDEDGGDLERTEEKSAAELEALVKAAESSKIEDEVTHTGDPDEIERAALASAHPGPDEDEAPPSSEAMPVSMREIEAEPASSHDFEPVSLHDVELAMAPGKAPPRIPAAPPIAPRVPALPRAPVKAATDQEPSKPAQEDKPAGPVLAGAAATRPKIVPRAPLKARQASQPDPEEAGAVPAIRPRLSSVPPPLPKPGSDDEMLRLSGGLSGGLAAPLVPADLVPPQIADASSASGETPGHSTEARARPAPPKKKKKAPEPASAPTTDDASASPKSKRPSKSPANGGTSEADEAPKKSKRPPKSERPAAAASKRPPADAQTTPPDEAPKSRTTTYLLVAAALAIGGYFAFGRSTEPPKPEVRTDVTSRPMGEPKADPVGQTADAPTAESPPSETSAPPVPSSSAPTSAPTTPTTAKVPPTSNTVSSSPTATPPSTPTAAPPTTTQPTASAAPAVASGPFDKSAASAAMTSAVGTASGCKKEGDPSGVARVSVTFAPSGRVTQANIGGPPFAGTPTGGCIAKAFKTAKVPPFEGDPVTVTKTVNIP